MSTPHQWRARPWATVLVKAVILLVPIAAGTTAGLVLARLVPPPDTTLLRVGWSILVLGVSTLTLMAVERLARRLAPLALLLRMSLVFPDQAPKRFGLALRAGKPGQRTPPAGSPLAARDSLVLLASLLAHDRRTRGHSERVAAYATMIAEELGVEGEEFDRLAWGALLHDVGKLQVPSRILNKPAALDDAEWRIMAGHPAFGSSLVDPLRPWLGDALSAVDGHHERFDGTGYPYRRRSADLPLAARIVAVADAFEVMTAARSYKEPMPISAARAEVAACAGKQFDPQVCRAFLDLSVPQLWRVAGPMAWLAQVPGIGLLVRGELVPATLGTAAQSAAMATGQAVTAAAVVGGALMATSAVTAPLPTRPVAAEVQHEDAAATPADPASSPPHGGRATTTDPGTGDDTPADGPTRHPGRGGVDDPDTPTGPGDDGGVDGTTPPSDTPAGGDDTTGTTTDPGTTTPGSTTTPGNGGVVGGVVDGVDGVVDGVTGGDVGGVVDGVGGVVDGVVGGVDDVVGGLVGGGRNDGNGDTGSGLGGLIGGLGLGGR